MFQSFADRLPVITARKRLDPALSPELGLCFDPTNPVMSGLAGDPLEELGRLPPDMLMLAHFKQCVGRSMIPTGKQHKQSATACGFEPFSDRLL